jgi:hypothetical protein
MSGRTGLPSSLLPGHIVFRSPLYAIADSGLPATLVVLTRAEMLEFEVMIRPIEAAGRGNGNRIGPQLAQIDGDRGAPPPL